MVRLRFLVFVALAALAVPELAAGAGVDKGISRPPKNLTEYHKAIWMTEWVACWRPPTITALARDMQATEVKIYTPQQGARALAKRAMRFLYEDPAERETATDGCRNGILWRFYHRR